MRSSFSRPVQIRELLSPQQAAALIAEAEAAGFDGASGSYPPSYRNNRRRVADDPARAARLFERLSQHLPVRHVDADGEVWTLAGLNTRFRFCRYDAGHAFTIHRDGAHHEGARRRSFLTVMLYLNDASEFEGGATRFYASRDAAAGTTEQVIPACGTAVVFSHALWHDGAPVEGGRKYIMRTDVMYQRESAVAATGHHGYVWAAAALEGGAKYATGGRDRTVRIWDDAGFVEVLEGHPLSVTAVGSDGARRLWTGCRDGSVRWWRRGDAGWRLRATEAAHAGAVVSTTQSAAGALATGGADAQIAVWTVDGELVRREHRHESWVWALDWTPDGELISVSEDGTIAGATARATAGTPLRAVRCIGDRIVTGDSSGKVCVWNRAFEQVARWHGHHGPVTDIAALPSGTIATAAEDGCVRLWRDTGRCQRTWEQSDYVRALLVRPSSLLCVGYAGIREYPL